MYQTILHFHSMSIEKLIRQKRLEFLIIEIYKDLISLSPQIINILYEEIGTFQTYVRPILMG